MDISFNLGGRRYDDLASLLAGLPDDAFASANRSTLPLIDYWREPAARLSHLRSVTGIHLEGPVELHFEYAVSPTQGRGKASFTDLMVIAPNAAIAIEAKFTELVYEAVSEWLGDSSENRVNVLNGWLKCINHAAQSQLTIQDVLSLPYQLIHRTASVCTLPVETRAVLYQTFGDPPENHYAIALRRLEELGVTGSIKLLEMNIRTTGTKELKEIERSLKKGTPELKRRLREMLAQRPLFLFGD